MCAVLEVSRAAFYAWVSTGSTKPKNACLDVHIKAIHRRSRGTYGSPRVYAELVSEGWTVGVNRVAERMRALDLSGIPKRKRGVKTTVSGVKDRFPDNVLNRDFVAGQPNQAWVADITYLATDAGWRLLSRTHRPLQPSRGRLGHRRQHGDYPVP